MAFPTEPLDTTINFRCPGAMKAILTARAKSENRTLGNYLVSYLAKRLDEEDASNLKVAEDNEEGYGKQPSTKTRLVRKRDQAKKAQ